MYLYLLSVNPQTNVENQHFIFRHTKQKTDDVDEVRVELKALAVTYSFHDLDAEVKPQLITGCRTAEVREKGPADRAMTLNDSLAYDRNLQLTSTQT